jgi:hypothetical protein
MCTGIFAQELVDGLICFHLCGVLGWSGTPAAFQVVTRAIKWELAHKLRRKHVMYVDDILYWAQAYGVTYRWTWPAHGR